MHIFSGCWPLVGLSHGYLSLLPLSHMELPLFYCVSVCNARPYFSFLLPSPLNSIQNVFCCPTHKGEHMQRQVADAS
jgi:hypothetical protein